MEVIELDLNFQEKLAKNIVFHVVEVYSDLASFRWQWIVSNVKCKVRLLGFFTQKRISNRKALHHEHFWAIEGDKQSGLTYNCLN